MEGIPSLSAAASRDHTTAPVSGVERVQDAGGPEGVDAPAAEGRGPARAGAGVRLEEPGRVGVRPHRRARWRRRNTRRPPPRRAAPACRCGCPGPRRTTSPVRPAGATARRAATPSSRSRCGRRGRRRPARVRGSPASGSPGRRVREVRVAPRARPGAGWTPFPRLRRRGRRARGRRRGRGRGRRAAGPGQEPFLGALRPAPVELRDVVAADAFRADERPRSAGEQDRHGDRGAPRSIGEAAADGRPRDQGQAHGRDGVADEPQLLHRLVFELPCTGQPREHQDDAAQALEPARPAQERPPQNDGQHGAERPHHPARKAREAGHDGLHAEPGGPQQRHSHHSGPHPERLPRGSFVRVFGGHGGFLVHHDLVDWGRAPMLRRMVSSAVGCDLM